MSTDAQRAASHGKVRAPERFWVAVGAQLRRPSGSGGAVIGALMSLLNAAPYRRAIAALELNAEDCVLELGFGTGQGLAALAAAAPQGRIAGIDHSPDMVARASRRNRAVITHGRMSLVRGDFVSLPWPGACFDKVLMVNVVYFFDRSGVAASETFRVLRPGGRVAIYATDRDSMQRLPFAGAETHRLFDAGELTRLLRQAGFEDRNIVTERVPLAFGINGLLATASKASRACGNDEVG